MKSRRITEGDYEVTTKCGKVYRVTRWADDMLPRTWWLITNVVGENAKWDVVVHGDSKREVMRFILED